MLVREEVVFAAHVGHLQESQALSSERLGSPALYFPVQSDPLEKGYRLCARACLITADLYTTIGMVSLKALVIMIVRHLHNVHELLSILAQPTAEMRRLHEVLSEHGRFPARRTWERRLKAIPDTLPAQIGCLGRHLIDLIQPWAAYGRAAAIDSTILRARGGVWHQKHREQGELPHTSIDPEAHYNDTIISALGILDEVEREERLIL